MVTPRAPGRRLGEVRTTDARALSQLLSAESRIRTMDGEIERAKEHLTNKMNSFVIHLRDCVPLEILGDKHAFQFFFQLLNYEPFNRTAARLRYRSFIDFQA